MSLANLHINNWRLKGLKMFLFQLHVMNDMIICQRFGMTEIRTTDFYTSCIPYPTKVLDYIRCHIPDIAQKKNVALLRKIKVSFFFKIVIIYNIIFIIILTSWEFFTSALADGLSLSDNKSPGLFSRFWPISTMLSFGLSPLVPLFSCPIVL